MKIIVITVGKEKDEVSKDFLSYYQVKLLRFLPVEWVYIEHAQTKEKEGEKILEHIKKEDYVVLLDERELRKRARQRRHAGIATEPNLPHPKDQVFP
jgi:23S rRNA pseudoU1915 N3-methylase RlmH